MSKAEFQKLHDDIKALRSAGKSDELAKKFVAKDAVFMGPLHEPSNIEGVLATSNAEQLQGKVQLETKVDEVTQLGDIVVERASLTVKRPEGERNGWSLTVWVKEGGQWKIRNACTTFKMPRP